MNWMWEKNKIKFESEIANKEPNYRLARKSE